ncbi:MAG: hypothetical protein ABS59_02740 [Methylobacterium sp. SCN 67-24]|nr:MAG: hypothetical protein ABS59_02740 [Methylobacterium sp. SCN 67-24]
MNSDLIIVGIKLDQHKLCFSFIQRSEVIKRYPVCFKDILHHQLFGERFNFLTELGLSFLLCISALHKSNSAAH